MLLYQARQDFIDMHFELFNGKTITLEHYNKIADELLRMDEINLELTLDYIQQTEHVPIKHVWNKISQYIANLKQEGRWAVEKEQLLHWTDNGISIIKSNI